jgi:hypothetical protein
MFSTLLGSGLLGFSLLGGAAHAAPWAEVDAIWAPDATGQWRRVDRSGAAVRVGESNEEVLRVGFDLDEGDRIRTTQARVRIRLRKKGQIVVRPESDVQLVHGGVLQEVGEVFYSVEGAFRVQYRGIEASVEGTQFTVGPDADGEGIEVVVGEGRVRVASQNESVLVRAGRVAQVLPGAKPSIPVAMSPATKAAFRGLRQKLGLPSASVSLLSTQSIGALNGGWNTGFRVQGRLRIFPGVRLVAESGMASDLTHFSLHESLGLERSLGPLSMAVNGDLRLGKVTSCQGEKDFGARSCQGEKAFGTRVGASTILRYRLPLPHGIGLETQLRLSYDGQLSGELGLGVSFGS